MHKSVNKTEIITQKNMKKEYIVQQVTKYIIVQLNNRLKKDKNNIV